MGHTVIDYNDKIVRVGDNVIFWGVNTGIVEKITEPDGDYNDELEQAELYPPKIYIRFKDGSEQIVKTYDKTYYNGPDYECERTFQAEDIAVYETS